jgi:CubicO group peptidase (beta-lactamase class C family)
MWSRALVLSCLALLSVAPAALADTDPGTAEWQQVPRDRMAQECGMDPALLEGAAAKLLTTPFVVIRHGKLCWEGGYPGGSTTPYEVFSVTKTFGALLVGMVAARSSFSDEDLVTRWVPAEELGGVNPQARIAHLLSMVGTNADLAFGKKGAWSYDTFGDREINLLVRAMNRAIEQEPAAFGGAVSIGDFARRELFEPLGMARSAWPGKSIGTSLNTSVRDMARLAQLILQRGRWNGRQLIEEDYVYRLTHPAFEDVNTGYGYLTYVNAAKGWSYPTSTSDTYCSPYGSWPRYPHGTLSGAEGPGAGEPLGRAPRHDIGMVFASGTGGQKFIVHRGLDLVFAVRDAVVGVGESGTAVDLFPGHKTVWNALRPALLAHDAEYRGDEAGFCAAYRRSEYAPTLREPWSPAASGAVAPVTCVSRRRFTLHVDRPRGVAVRRVVVTVDGRRVAVRRGRRFAATVDLAGRGPGVAVVRIRIEGRRGGRAVVVRRERSFRTCGRRTPSA